MDDTELQSSALAPEQRAILNSPHGAATSHWLTIVIDEAVDATQLRAALAAVALRHDVLAQRFCKVAGYRELRCVAQVEPLPPTLIEVKTAAWDEATRRIWVRDFVCAPFSIGEGQLLRAALLRGATSNTLVVAASALALDGASLCVLCEQISAQVRSAGVRGETEADDFFQYSQFVEWRDELSAGEDAAEGGAYWQAYLRGEIFPHQLVYRREGSEIDAEPISLSCAIEPALFSRLNRFAESAGVEVDLVLQSLWWWLLARLSEGRRVGGWLHDCRRDYEVMCGALGVFEKVLPVVVESADGVNFSAWLAAFSELAEAHSAAQEYWPVDAPPNRAHQRMGFASTHCNLPTRWHLQRAPALLDFELALQVVHGTQSIVLVLQGDAARYSQLSLRRLSQQFATLLESALMQPEAPLGQLVLVGAEERAALLAINTDKADFGKRAVIEQIADWARCTPGAPALIDGQREYSYGQLWCCVEAGAARLRREGVGSGALVALRLPRSAELVVAMLAVWRAGAAFVVLEPEWPESRMQSLLNDAAPALVLRAAHAPLGEEAGRHHRYFEIETSDVSDDLPPLQSALTDIAYVLYTSGSTGHPKGVVIEQGQLLNYVAAASAALALGASRRWALTSSVAADLGHTALFGALFNGCCLIVASADDTRDATAFSDFMARHAIDGVKIVPSHLEALLEGDAPCLPRTLVLGGEAPSAALIARIAQLAPDCRIYNHYGPTETTVGVLVHDCLAARDVATSDVTAVPLTRVLANNRVYVLDRNGALAPTGVKGELFIGGPQLCRGYLNRDNADVFVADPFEPGQRLYRSGDLAYALPEGGVRLAGRADFQLKIQGFRVEPAEIEAVLLGEAGVRQAIVLPVAGADVQLGAYLIGEEGLEPESFVRELRVRLQAQLPIHMRPARYVLLDEFPRLANGKIDRQALAVLPELKRASPSSEPARDALDRLLVGGMARLLGGRAVGIDDDFFELGGHSLLVIKLVARLRKWLGIDIAPAVVFDFPTARELADALRADRDVAALLELAEAALKLAPEPEPDEAYA